MLVLMGLAFMILLVRLRSLQLIQGSQYRELSVDNFISERRVVPFRGMIYDRNGILLADNQASFDLFLTPAFCKKDAFDDTMAILTEYLGLEEEEVDRTQRAYHRRKGLDRFLPVLIHREMTWDELALVEQNKEKLEGVDVQPAVRRVYPNHKLAAHLLGYVGEISPSELASRKGGDYRQGDYIGKAGVEKAFEDALHGRSGKVKVVVDAKGQKMPSVLAKKILGDDGVIIPVEPGKNLILSIDSRLQRIAEERFPGQEGAVVAVEPKTGFILAMVSKPAFDPNMISGKLDPHAWMSLVRDVDKPLTNRATQQHYPPGSTFKPFTGLAALSTEGFSPETKELCTGGLKFGDHYFRCWRSGGHGRIALHRAVVQSCDVYFYRAGLKAGLDRVAEVARSFGFGSRSGIKSCIEVPGIIPDKAWYQAHTKWGFLPGFTLSDSIGQGDVNVTPLQLAMAYAALANGGILYRPQVVLREETPDGKVTKVYEPIIRGHVDATDENLRIMVEALTGVVNEPGGTAYYRRPRNVTFKAAGKTGTAQVVKQNADRGRNLPYDFRDHAWFAGWAPADDPQIAVAVVNEHGRHGSSGAAPLVMELITYYLVQLHGDVDVEIGTSGSEKIPDAESTGGAD